MGAWGARERVRRGAAAGLALLALFALPACVATETTVSSRGVIVSGPPPAPLLEAQRPAAPATPAVWVAGYWHWTGMQYTWIPGHWDEHAPPGAAWAAPRYVSADGAYFYEAGGWKLARPSAAPAPRASSATANALR